MNFTALQAELAARGFDYLSTTRQGQYINAARAELDELELWFYRSTTASGAAPLTVSDLGTVETVYDSVQKQILDYQDRASLSEDFSDLTLAGTPQFWYKSSPTVVSVWPVATDSITVTHWKVPADLVAGSDTPLAPSRYHNVIVDIAVRMAYRDADNHEAAEALQAQIDRDVQRMRLSQALDSQEPTRGVYLREGWW